MNDIEERSRRLEWAERSIPTLADLLTSKASDLLPEGIAVNNLVCATGLPGAEDLSLPKYLRRLDALTGFVRRETERDLRRFRDHPNRYPEFVERSEAFFRAASLVTVLKSDCGLRYNPDMVAGTEDRCRLGYMDCGDLLINGLLSDRRTGTCNSIPVLTVAVGRRLGYPLYVSANRHHVFARWDGVGPGSAPGGERFNIEASNGGGMDSPTDDHYRAFPYPMEPWEQASGYYLQNFTPADELALAMLARAWVLTSHGRFEESLPVWAKCCFLAPAEPSYPRMAIDPVMDALYLRKHGRIMPRRGKKQRPDAPDPILADLDPRRLLSRELMAMVFSIQGHWNEVNGRASDALLAYREACMLDTTHFDHASDEARFRQKSGETRIASARGATKPLGDGCDRAPGSLAEAQAQYSLAAAHADPMMRQECHIRLQRTIEEGLLSETDPVPFPWLAGDDCNDPRLRLPETVQAVIWAARGRVLERMGRFNKAVLAFSRARELSPKNPQYPHDVHRAASRETTARGGYFDTITVATPHESSLVWSPQFQIAAQLLRSVEVPRQNTRR